MPEHFDVLKRIIHEKYLPPLKLHEFFMIDVDLVLYDLKQKSSYINETDDLKIILDPERKRFGSTVSGCVKNDQDLRAVLEDLNKKAYDECQNHINNAIDNVINGAKYERLDDKGTYLTGFTFFLILDMYLRR